MVAAGVVAVVVLMLLVVMCCWCVVSQQLALLADVLLMVWLHFKHMYAHWAVSHCSMYKFCWWSDGVAGCCYGLWSRQEHEYRQH